jgi:DNA-binding GntR family transcriptional regulator
MQAENNGTLREKVYRYLRQELANGNLAPESYIDQNEICERLNISRAPMRDALIQLEAEHFVQIFPRRGVLIRKLPLKDIKSSYQIAAALESSVVSCEFDKLTTVHVQEMVRLNETLHTNLEDEKFDAYYENNLNFHRVYMSLSDNDHLKGILTLIIQRLYDFPRMQYNKPWERINLHEHRRFTDAVMAGNCEAAVSIIRNEHWSFDHHREYLLKVYGLEEGS